MQNKKSFCYDLYKNIAVWSHNGKVGYNPCCSYSEIILESDQIDLQQIWNSPARREILMRVENDQAVPGCEPCYKAEQAGMRSRRQASQELYENYCQDTEIDLDAPQALDYTVGNLCNLKCMICDVTNSSAWIPDTQRLWPNRVIDVYQKNQQIHITQPELLRNLRIVHFHGGGEPLLSTAHIELLQKIDQVKGLADVRVFYNTNGTVRVDDAVLRLWERCQLVELYFSIDDVGARFEYQRTGASWNDVTANLAWYQQSMPHNHMFNVNCTWGYLNLYYLNELVDWHCHNFSANRYSDPCNLWFQPAIGVFGLKNLDTNASQMLLQRFESYPQLQQLVNSIPAVDPVNHDEFWNLVDRIDTIRYNNFRKLCPEWSALLM
jgi:hypothetical protein